MPRLLIGVGGSPNRFNGDSFVEFNSGIEAD